MSASARARQAREEAESAVVQAQKDRARRAIEGKPQAYIVASSLQIAQGVAFTVPERHVRAISTRFGDGGLRGLGQGAIVYVHPSAWNTRYADDLLETLRVLEIAGADVREVKA